MLQHVKQHQGVLLEVGHAKGEHLPVSSLTAAGCPASRSRQSSEAAIRHRISDTDALTPHWDLLSPLGVLLVQALLPVSAWLLLLRLYELPPASRSAGRDASSSLKPSLLCDDAAART
jgi:hypothetical protein